MSKERELTVEEITIQDDIRKRYKAALLEVKKAQIQVDVQRVYLKAIASECEGHPRGWKTSSMGEIGFYCPDCGYSN